MEIISFENNILERIHDISNLEIKWKKENLSYVKKNDSLADITYDFKVERNKLFSQILGKTRTKHSTIVSQYEGYLLLDEKCGEDMRICCTNGYNTTIIKDPRKNNVFLKRVAMVFPSIEDLFSYYYYTGNSTIELDPYTNERRIEWEKHLDVQIGDGESFSLEFVNGEASFCFDTFDKLSKGDSVSFLFKNGDVVDYVIKSTSKNKCRALFTLYQEDLDAFVGSELISYRITYNKANESETRLVANDVLGHPYKNEAISMYVKDYLETLHKLLPNYQIPQRTVIKSHRNYVFEGCYVYLMHDISNGYYKIGISNKPEYREKTLQSEKPTIELLTCKKYPTRKIAEAIESALHSAYSQQRIRGEWFNLDDVDVATIIETLK
jgi:hypothetical protein